MTKLISGPYWDFPRNPILGMKYTVTWEWDGEKWLIIGTGVELPGPGGGGGSGKSIQQKKAAWADDYRDE